MDHETEHWLRLHGLPFFVKPRARARRLLAEARVALTVRAAYRA